MKAWELWRTKRPPASSGSLWQSGRGCSRGTFGNYDWAVGDWQAFGLKWICVGGLFQRDWESWVSAITAVSRSRTSNFKHTRQLGISICKKYAKYSCCCCSFLRIMRKVDFNILFEGSFFAADDSRSLVVDRPPQLTPWPREAGRRTCRS